MENIKEKDDQVTIATQQLHNIYNEVYLLKESN
jgi:hypothetical protein